MLYSKFSGFTDDAFYFGWTWDNLWLLLWEFISSCWSKRERLKNIVTDFANSVSWDNVWKPKSIAFKIITNFHRKIPKNTWQISNISELMKWFNRKHKLKGNAQFIFLYNPQKLGASRVSNTFPQMTQKILTKDIFTHVSLARTNNRNS